MMTMTASRIAFSRQGAAALPAMSPKAKSSLVRRLVAAENDPAKQRIRAWLADLEDEQLSRLGLTPQDVLILRGTRFRTPAYEVRPRAIQPCRQSNWRRS